MMNKRQHGFTLIEILVAVALLGGLALAGMTLFKNQNESQKTVEANYEVTTILSQMRSLLGSITNCNLSFQGANPSTGTRTRLMKDISGTPTIIYPINAQLPGNIRVLTYRLDKTMPGLMPNETILRISFSRGRSAIKDEITKSLKIVYTLDGGGNIQSCYAFNNTSDTYWVQSIPDPNDIHYPAGDVGIGQANPQSRLHVAGNILLHDGAADGPNVRFWDSSQAVGGKVWNIDSSAGHFRIFDEPIATLNPLTNSPGTTRMFINSATGNVGIGTTTPGGILDVRHSTGGGMLVQGSDGGLELASSNDASSYVDFRGSANLASDYRGRVEYTDGLGMWFMTGSSAAQRMVINETGQVGIGIVTPKSGITSNLQTNGDITMSTPGSANTLHFNSYWDAAWKTYNAGYAGALRFNSSTGTMEFWNSPSVVAADTNSNPVMNMIITPSGRVGLGIVTPDQQLTVTQGARIDGLNIGESGSAVDMAFPYESIGAGPGMTLRLQSANSIAFHTGMTNTEPDDNSKTRVLIDAGGNVGIGTSTPSYKVDIVGNVGAQAFFYTSDRSLKSNISTIENPLEKILALRGVNFTWKNSGQKDLGFVAQEVEKVEPSLVTGKEGKKAVKYGNIVAIIVEAIRELFTELNLLREENAELKKKVTNLEKRLEALEKK